LFTGWQTEKNRAQKLKQSCLPGLVLTDDARRQTLLHLEEALGLVLADLDELA